MVLLYVLAGMLCVLRLRKDARRLDDSTWQPLLREAAAQLHLRRRTTLLQGRREGVPMMWGWRQPMLLLPTGAEAWSVARKRLVLLHELAHVRRHDWLTQHLGHLVCVLHWFNPVAWMAVHSMRREREQACDDLVLRNGLRASEYAGQLLDVAKALPRPHLIEAGAVAMAHSGGIEGRIRRILDPLRRRHGVSRRVGVAATAIAAMLLIAVASVQASDAGGPDPAGHRPGLRDQWQPQTEHEPRLAQPVHLEILGRAAVPALELLSKETGVSLQIAPENLDTIGERKLTIIAQGCSLKSIMVQLANALQECHWDVDVKRKEPVYLLHRNAGVNATMRELRDEESRRRAEENRPKYEARIAEARRALAMSPQELEELKKTDPLLAAYAQDPEARKSMELFLTLPDDKMKQLADTGGAGWDYFGEAPERFREASRRLLEGRYKEALGLPETDRARSEVAELYKSALDHLSNVSIGYDGFPDPMRYGITLSLWSYGEEATLATGTGSVPPRLPAEHRTHGPREVLLRTGMDEKAADALLADLLKKGDERDEERKQQQREAEWQEPRSAGLHRMVTLPFSEEEAVDPIEVQRFIAKETGLSLVSDYYTEWLGGRPIPQEAKGSMPAWRLLYLLGDAWYWTYEWDEVGDCLVFHDKNWYRDVPRELPESMVQAYREKLKQQGRLTLEDVVAAAAMASRREMLRATGPVGNDQFDVPADLRDAGMEPLALASSAVLLYATLSPEQRLQALSEAGLPYEAMTPDQQSLARQSATERNDRRPMPEEKLRQAIYQIRERTSGEGWLLLTVKFPGRRADAFLRVEPAQPFPRPPAQ